MLVLAPQYEPLIGQTMMVAGKTYILTWTDVSKNLFATVVRFLLLRSWEFRRRVAA